MLSLDFCPPQVYAISVWACSIDFYPLQVYEISVETPSVDFFGRHGAKLLSMKGEKWAFWPFSGDFKSIRGQNRW